jgi:hypothetical protein
MRGGAAFRAVEGWLAAVGQLTGQHDAPDPVSWAERVSGQELDPWQRLLMASEHPALLLLTSRQVGKSHVVSLRAAYRAKHLRRRVGVLSPTLRQSGIVYRRACQWLNAHGRTDTERRTLTEVELVGGGSIIAFPGDRPDLAIRGDTLDDLIVDEASRIKDELIAAASPTVATRAGANITYLSSPAGQRGAFHRAWVAEEWWHKVKVTADQCPRISPSFLARERVRLGRTLYAQEYEAEFVASAGGLFDPSALDDVFGRIAQPALEAWLPEGNGHARAWL